MSIQVGNIQISFQKQVIEILQKVAYVNCLLLVIILMSQKNLNLGLQKCLEISNDVSRILVADFTQYVSQCLTCIWTLPNVGFGYFCACKLNSAWAMECDYLLY